VLSSKHDVNLRTSYAQTTLATTLFLILISSLQVPVWAVLGYTETRTISRELLLVKVSILSPEDQLAGGPSHEPCASHRAHAEQTKLVHEMALARHFEEADHPLPPIAHHRILPTSTSTTITTTIRDPHGFGVPAQPPGSLNGYRGQLGIACYVSEMRAPSSQLCYAKLGTLGVRNCQKVR
jgi:hypothetical protein